MNEINLDYNQILKLIPHRLPFLLIDRVENLVPDTSAVGIKSVTVTNPDTDPCSSRTIPIDVLCV